jgi:cell wall-associated NlpC family hydrolase
MSRTTAILGLTALLAACGGKTHAPSPFPDVRREPTSPVPAHVGTAVGTRAFERARALIGTPYRSGGATPSGFDCSGLVYYVFGQAGVNIPRTVRDLFNESVSVERDALAAGDLVFFRTNGHRISHVGIANGNGSFIHAPTSRGVVRVEQLSSKYWSGRFAGARRLPSAQ